MLIASSTTHLLGHSDKLLDILCWKGLYALTRVMYLFNFQMLFVYV